MASSDKGATIPPHPEVAAISAFTRLFDALWRPSKDARPEQPTVVENPFSTFCEWAGAADEQAYSGL
jgi:hypothetical protein